MNKTDVVHGGARAVMRTRRTGPIGRWYLIGMDKLTVIRLSILCSMWVRLVAISSGDHCSKESETCLMIGLRTETLRSQAYEGLKRVFHTYTCDLAYRS